MMEKALWAIQYTPRAAGMMKAMYTLIRGIISIMVLPLAAAEPWFWLPAMETLLKRKLKRPERMGISTMPIRAGVTPDFKAPKALLGRVVKSRPRK